MPFLDQLTVTDATPTRDRSPVGRFRRRLADGLRQQLQLANADHEGLPLNLTRQRWIRKTPGGEKELKQVPIRVRRWWWTDDAGKTYLSLRSGSRLLEIAPGKKAIEIGAAAELSDKLKVLCEAVMAGELDACAKEIASKLPPKGREKAPTPAKSSQGTKELAAKAH